ncbi:MAG: glucose-6-phosphate isomerase [Paludibacteraceae bacterium]|nr:glucose-6-phosphate isomerase [Paludibacteraceae bacterium]
MKLCLKNAACFVDAAALKQLESQTEAANLLLENGQGAGNDYIGWVHLPSSITDEFLAEVEECARVLRERCQVVIVAGIGGSYLGARAVNEALASSFDAFVANDRKNPYVVYAGNNIGEDYLAELMEFLADKQFGIINISKSGTTTETALAFRLLKTMLEKQVGKAEAQKRIVAVTDRAKGALRSLATKEGYKTFVIPDNVGGRFSVLTPVGLLPIAVAGGNIRELVRGAVEMEKATDIKVPYAENPACQYAAMRNALYQGGKKIEILVNFNPKLHYFSEWWKQLYGESEGKDHKAIFPASVDFTTDLHSMGQWIQDGERTIFETVISIEKANKTVLVPTDEENLDGLNFLAGKRVDEVNKNAELGTQLAHVDGGVPNIHISFEKIDEYNIGQFIYFFERACGISGYVLGVNPFNQPGVEAYKKNMFALLNKPGYEAESKAIQARLNK